MKLLKSHLIILAILSFLNLNAQEKKTYYFNENFNLLNKDDFNALTSDKERFAIHYEIDTAFISVSYKTILRGQLQKEEFDNLKTSLKNSVKESFNPDGFIVIDFNPGILKCNNSNKGISTWNIYDKDYLRKLNKIYPTNHFWIYKEQSKVALEYHHSGRIDWNKDPNALIEKMFFPFGPISCYGVVIISDTGAYISYHTEYGKQDVWRFTEDLIELSKANN